MAEVLVKAVDETNSDSTKDLRGCFKQGDVVVVRENGHMWGNLEVVPPKDGGKFVVIKITDVTRNQVLNWMRNNWNLEAESGDDIRKRTVRIDIDLVPNSVKQELNRTGQYSATWSQIRDYVRNKVTNSTASTSIL